MAKKIPYDEETIERLSISTGISKKVIISYWNKLIKNHNLSIPYATEALKTFFLVRVKTKDVELLKELGLGRNKK